MPNARTPSTITPFLLTHALLAAGALTDDARILNLASFVEKRDATDPDVSGASWRDRYYPNPRVQRRPFILLGEHRKQLLAGDDRFNNDDHDTLVPDLTPDLARVSTTRRTVHVQTIERNLRRRHWQLPYGLSRK